MGFPRLWRGRWFGRDNRYALLPQRPPYSVTNARGAKTTCQLDGLNRVNYAMTDAPAGQSFRVLGGHLKTGQSWTLQNRPLG
jgi:hypothetical protein